MKLLTNLLFEPKGKHDPALEYRIKDTVMSADGSQVYFALQDVPAGIALSNAEYWMLQIDMHDIRTEMENAVANFGERAKAIGTRVRGEIAKASGNPVAILPDAGSLLQPVTVLEPKQEGSGDPYPAGGGRNLFNPQQNGLVIRDTTIDGDVLTTEFASGALYIQTTDVYPAGTYTISVIPISDDISCSLWLYDANDNSETFGTAFSKSKNSYTFTKDAPFYFGIGGISAALGTFRYKIQLETGATATEYQSWENIRPITGYDAVELNHTGKNLAEIKYPVDGVTTENADGTITVTNKTSADISGAKCELTGVLPPGTYTVSKYDTNGNVFLQTSSSDYSNNFTTYTFDYDGASYLRIVCSNIKAGESVTYKIQLECGSTATDFQPYTNTLHTVHIGQTVYGGKFDWLTGKLVAEWAMRTLDGTETLRHETSWENNPYAYELRPILADAALNTHVEIAQAYCSHLAVTSVSNIINSAVNTGFGIYEGYLVVDMGNYSTADELKAAIAAQYTAGTPVRIAYKLATPIEIQLTPHIISAAEPEQTNTLYGDGSIEVEYVKPLHVSIEERVAVALAAVMQTE